MVFVTTSREVTDATPVDIAKFYGNLEITTDNVLKAIRRGDLVAGVGGLVEIENGQWFAFLEMPARERKPSMYRHILECFEIAKGRGAKSIRAFCDGSIPGAEKLMARLGFVRTDEVVDDRNVWLLVTEFAI